VGARAEGEGGGGVGGGVGGGGGGGPGPGGGGGGGGEPRSHPSSPPTIWFGISSGLRYLIHHQGKKVKGSKVIPDIVLF
jgi:hypothetical protein